MHFRRNIQFFGICNLHFPGIDLFVYLFTLTNLLIEFLDTFLIGSFDLNEKVVNSDFLKD